jgi:osmotically-inducible protein OsmY
MGKLTGIIAAAAIGAALSAAPAWAANNAPPDGWITTRAKLSLFTSANMRSSAVHVDTIEGVVTLYGTVNELAQKDLAERTVKDIKGVRGVRDLLQVVPAAEQKQVAHYDGDVKNEIQKVLKDDPALKESRISVKAVDHGVVLLTGKAQTISDQLRAVSDVHKVPGVHRVATQIEGPEMYTQSERRLGPENEKQTPMGGLRTSLSDTRITTEVKANLLSAKEVPWNNINVDTSDGVVTLFGTVPTDPQKEAASAQAQRVPGVVRVKNELQVKKAGERAQTAISDDDIIKQLDNRFRGQSQFKHVGYSVKDGAVRLTGTVESGWDRLQALRNARSIYGVHSVFDDIQLSALKPEQSIRESLRGSLREALRGF